MKNRSHAWLPANVVEAALAYAQDSEDSPDDPRFYYAGTSVASHSCSRSAYIGGPGQGALTVT
jgi:hypothetical protein